jgi:membrane-bound ClpP family serine protease
MRKHSHNSLQVIVRRILILVVYVALYTKATQRAYGIAILSLLCLLVHSQCNPFKEADDNALESLSLLMLAYAAITACVFQDGGGCMGVYGVVCVSVCVCLCLTFSSRSWRGRREHAWLDYHHAGHHRRCRNPATDPTILAARA